MPFNVKKKLRENKVNKSEGGCKLAKEDYERLIKLSIKPPDETENSGERGLAPAMKWPKRRRPAPSQEEVEARLEAEHYLARAKQLQLEQEDEVKLANKIILATKCQAIRDAQLAEKQRIEAELVAEDRRVEAEMEVARVAAVARQAKRRESQQLGRERYVTTLLQQVAENEHQRRLDEERAAKESRKLRELHAQREREEAAAERARVAEQLKIRQELHVMNQAIQHRHVMEQAQEKMANLRIQQFMLGKAAREAEREERRCRLRQAQEREVARLRALQQRQQEIRDRAFSEAVERDQEMVAREWRAKELKAVKKRVEMEAELKEERAKQAAEKLRLQALELQREELQVQSVLALQVKALEVQQKEKTQHEQTVARYRQALQQQMLEKEEARRAARRQLEEDARQAREEQATRDRDLRGALHLKVKELRSFKVPEKYVSGVERQLGLRDSN